ncbi:hypothetical protein PI124_g4732 [Phytophthora idaei]|nr:hypothetical protein PI125_g4397 [Phytophthora idaei]KAG3162829.1 hypothetical protein PI126_g5812 [Phytophthora idaei]KAG3250615.1 hypothetical protein PI124_g4732 [Phytophthora idaei]
MMNHVPATLRKMYVQQANEKVMVKKELELLDHYKLVGEGGPDQTGLGRGHEQR